jgi:crotonobetainyl-CoA:carnitine CoA-transferase CaiB-like acyl-CoA transferase
MVERRRVAGEVYARLADYCAEFPSEALIEAFSDRGVSVTPVRTVKDVLSLPETRALGLVQDVADRDLGSLPIPTGVFASTIFGDAPQRREPELGEHTASVLHDLLGYADTQIEELRNQGVIIAPATSGVHAG